MRRKIESLTQKRQELEKEFQQRLQKLKKTVASISPSEAYANLNQQLSSLLETSSSSKKIFKKKQSRKDFSLLALLKNLVQAQEKIHEQNEKIIAALSQIDDLFLRFQNLVDAKDQEWDALSSNHVGLIFKSLEWRVEKLAVETQDAKLLVKKLYFLRDKLDALIQELSAHESKSLSTTTSHQILNSLKDAAYVSFENRFRGDEAQVKEELSRYQDFFERGKVVDLGCGRGEFLEILQEKGIEAEGIDLNQEMVEYCREKSLTCHQDDLLAWLVNQPDESLAGIFSSQVIEHLPPSYLRQLIQQAYFKLAPGGKIILETINPTSVFALVQIYFLDFSHSQPIHPLALQFLLENHGFEEVRILYGPPPQDEQLQTLPSPENRAEIFNSNIDKLNKLLFAPLNYAVTGVKS